VEFLAYLSSIGVQFQLHLYDQNEPFPGYSPPNTEIVLPEKTLVEAVEDMLQKRCEMNYNLQR